MNSIHAKLHSSDGISIVIALVGFLVASVVSVVIVTAALSSARTVATDVKSTQSRLTLESAAMLLEKEMEATECFLTEIDYNEEVAAPEENDSTTTAYTGSLGEAMQTAIEALQDSTVESYEGTFSISADDLGLESVTVTYTVQKDTYDAVFDLVGEVTGTRLRLTMKCYTSINDEGTVTKSVEKEETLGEDTYIYYETENWYTKKTYTYRWTNGSIGG